MRVFVLTAVVAIGLAVILLWRGSAVSLKVNRVSFLVGLATVAMIPALSGGSWSIHFSRGPMTPVTMIAIAFLAATPYLILIESGIAGYRGFTSWPRYLCLVLSALGGIGFLASVVLPIARR